MVRIAVNGALGHMGRETIRQALGNAEFRVVAGIDHGAVASEGDELSYPLLTSLNALDMAIECIIDFSRPSALPGLLRYATAHKVALVIGTTGFSAADRRLIEDAARVTAIFMAPNMAYGIAVLADLTRQAVKALGGDFDVEISESHHRRKIDAPSGTALMLADAVAGTSAESMSVVFDRTGRHEARRPREIGVVSLRGGTVAGQHTVSLFGDDETIELTHTALSQKVMAGGALRAAAYVAGKAPGLYTMDQLLAEQSLVTHIGLEREVAVLSLRDVSAEPGDVANVFDLMSGINVDMISATTPLDGRLDLAFSVPQGDLGAAVQALGASGQVLRPRVTEHLAKLTVEGEGMAITPGVTARIFACLAECDVSPCQVTTSETKITMAVEVGHARRVIESIEQAFGL